MWKAYARLFFLHQKCSVRSGIRTHAHRSGLRPERSVLDLSAILTTNTSKQLDSKKLFLRHLKIENYLVRSRIRTLGTEVDWPLNLTVSPP